MTIKMRNVLFLSLSSLKLVALIITTNIIMTDITLSKAFKYLEHNNNFCHFGQVSYKLVLI